jgi:hypothetical protein
LGIGNPAPPPPKPRFHGRRVNHARSQQKEATNSVPYTSILMMEALHSSETKVFHRNTWRNKSEYCILHRHRRDNVKSNITACSVLRGILNWFILIVPPLWSTSQEFLAANPEVPGSIPGVTRFSEWQWVWNGVHSAFESKGGAT